MSQLHFEPVTGALGAEVTGLDLREPLSPEVQEQLHEGWMEHLVLFFRGQEVTRDQHKAFARNFGKLHVHPVLQPLKDEGHPEIVMLVSNEKQTSVADRWHRDVTFQRVPPLGSVLHGVTVPEAGGDTMWANMVAACEALSDRMQRLLSELRGVNDGGGFKSSPASAASRTSMPTTRRSIPWCVRIR